MFFQKLKTILLSFAHVRINGNVTSQRTITARHESITSSFRKLHKLGYKITDPQNLQPKHVQALVDHWLYKEKLGPKTIETHLSCLRVFSGWIGKKGMIKSKYDYVKSEDRHLLVVETAAKKSKSWTGNNINLPEIFDRIDRKDFRLGLMLRMELSFGLRRDEVLKCNPHSQDYGNFLAIFKGQAKGGKTREIFTLTSGQREILDFVKSHIHQNEEMGWPYNKDGSRATLLQNRRRYSNLMLNVGISKRELGVTGHGLRAQFAENQALIQGILPPSMGGTKGQMNKVFLKTRLQKISEAMGHHREIVMTAYFCSFGRNVTLDRADRCMRNIDAATMLLKNSDLDDLCEEYKEDCIHIRNVLEILDVDISLKQVQHLWRIYSKRNGVQWMTPNQEIGICIEAACLFVTGVK